MSDNPFADLVAPAAGQDENPFADLVKPAAQPAQQPNPYAYGHSAPDDKNQDGIPDYMQVKGQPGVVNDLWSHTSSAFVDSFSADAKAGQLITGAEWMGKTSDSLADKAKGIREGLSEDAQEAGSKEWVSEGVDEFGRRDKSFGDAWGDIDAWNGLLGSAVGSMGAVVAGGGVTKIAATVGLRSTARLLGREAARKAALRKTVRTKGAEAADKQLKGFKKFDEGMDSAVGTASYAASEGGMVGGAVARDVEQSVLEMPAETLSQAPLFQETYWGLVDGEGMSHEEAFDQARKVTATVLATDGMANAAIPSLLLGAVGGRFLDKALKGKLEGSRAARGGKGLATETFTEAGQGGVEHLASGTALQQVDPSIDPTEGLANAMVAEGLGGGIAGGAMGLASRTPDQIESGEVSGGGQSNQSADMELRRLEGETQAEHRRRLRFTKERKQREAEAFAEAQAAANSHTGSIMAQLQQVASRDQQPSDIPSMDMPYTPSASERALAGVTGAATEGQQATNIPMPNVDRGAMPAASIPTLTNRAKGEFTQAGEIPTLTDVAEGEFGDTHAIPTLTDRVQAPEYDGQQNLERASIEDLTPDRKYFAQAEEQGLSRRWGDGGYRFEVDQMAKSLETGGGVSYLYDEHDRITGRTGSVNPQWFQGNGDMSSVKYVRDTVNKALRGEKLGKRQKRIVEAMMDVIDDLNGEYGESYGEYGAFDPDNGIIFTRGANGAVHYNPQDGGGARTVAMLEEEARDAGVPEDLIASLVKLKLPVPKHAEALYEAVKRANKKRANPQGNKSGAREVSRTEKAAPEESAAAPGGKAEADPVRSEPEGLDPAKSEPDSGGKVTPPGVGLLEERLAKEKEKADKLWYNQHPEARKYADKWKPKGETSKAVRKLTTEQGKHWRVLGGLREGGSIERFRELEDQINALLGADFDEYMSEYTGPGAPQSKQDEIAAAANEADTNPSLLQKEAGNYKKGRIVVHGIKIGIENPAGSTRSGTGTDGKPWEVELTHHYGDITGVTGADGDQLDVFVNADGNPEDSTSVYIVDQIDDDGNFDEHKVLLGFPDYKVATKAYLEQYDDKFRGKHGPIEGMNIEKFKDWLANGDKTQPLHWSLRSRRHDEKQHDIYDSRIIDAEVRDRNYANLDNVDLDTAKKLIEQLRTELNTSERTGLGSNRAWINRTPKKFTASIDVDSLKWVNDNMGHGAGDQLLAKIGEAMREVGLGEDAFHVSGDEFYAHGDDTVKLRAKLREALKWLETQTISAEGYEYTGPGFSFGISEDLESAEIRLRDQKADREKRGKRASRGNKPRGVVKADGPDNRSGGSEGDSAQTAGDAEGEALLTSYSEEELAEREEQRKADEKKKAEAEAKAKADDERDGFTLTGSKRPADVAAAQGQGDIFGAKPKADPIQDFLDGKRDDAPTVEEVESAQQGDYDLSESAIRNKLSTDKKFKEAFKSPKGANNPHIGSTPAADFLRGWLDAENDSWDESKTTEQTANMKPYGFNPMDYYYSGYLSQENGYPVARRTIPVLPKDMQLEDDGEGFSFEGLGSLLDVPGDTKLAEVKATLEAALDAIGLNPDGRAPLDVANQLKKRLRGEPHDFHEDGGIHADANVALESGNYEVAVDFEYIYSPEEHEEISGRDTALVNILISGDGMGRHDARKLKRVELSLDDQASLEAVAKVIGWLNTDLKKPLSVIGEDAAQVKYLDPMQPGDIGTKSGKPFKTDAAARKADKAADHSLSANGSLVEVEGGVVWRPDAMTKADKEAKAKAERERDEQPDELADNETYDRIVRMFMLAMGVRSGTVAGLQRPDVDFLFAGAPKKWREGLAAYIASYPGVASDVKAAMQWAVRDSSGHSDWEDARYQGKTFEEWKAQREHKDDNGGKAPASNGGRKDSKKPSSYGTKNKLVSKDRAEELKKQLLAELGTLNSGLNPKIMAIGTELAVFHIEAGARKFVEMAQAIADDLGVEVQKLKPYLRMWYNGARDMLEDNDLDVSDMDTPEQVKAGLKEILEADASKQELHEFLGERLDAMRDNRGVKAAMAQYLGVKPAEVTAEHMKQAQEAIEVALVQRAREIMRKGSEEKAVYDELVSMYENQPNLNVRSSTSIENQAYSTPAPIAMLASQLAGIDVFQKVYEPTAGNGMLLIGADIETTDANELDPNRAASLRKLGFNVTSNDGATYVPEEKAYDAVIMNPPFGPLDRFGHPSVVQYGDGYNLKKIDHLITAKALEAMKDSGRAVIIIGANKEAGEIGNGADRVFFNWLYSNYNVADHFEIDGDLYKRQGAGWPIRVIVVNGREQSKRLSPKSGTIERLDNWNEIYERYNQTQELLDSQGPQSDGRGEADSQPTPQADQQGGRAESDGRKVKRPSGGGGGGRKSRVPKGDNADTGNTDGRGGDSRGDGRVSDDRGADSGADTRVQHESDQARRTEPSADIESAGTDAGKPAGGARKKRVGGKASSFQTEYETRSGGANEAVLTPRNMAGPVHRALDEITKAVGGDLDAYVMDKLGYKTKAELHKAFMGLQVDTVAAAIYNHENRDRGIIIADQTGVGKGRQAAAMIRYAQRIGKTPVFISVKPNLFTDMYEDSLDIGNADLRPAILNKGEAVVSGEDKLFQTTPRAYKQLKEDILSTGKLPADRNALFLTYSQLTTPNEQRDILRALRDPFFILDEAHNAAGDHVIEKKINGKKEKVLTGAGFISGRIKDQPVTYLSATYAKRPDNMPVYHRTDLVDAVDNMAELAGAMERGGVPLQQVASAMLSENGQLFRRERSFEGINIPIVVDYDNYDAHAALSDQVTTGLRAIVTANKAFQELVKENGDMFAPEGGSAKMAGNNAQQTGNVNPFTSVVHNYIEQLLLGLKAKKTAETAIALVKQGKKPVIAFQNTMGSFLSDFAADQGIKPGDPIDFSYNDVMLNALTRSRRISFKDAKGNSVPRQVELDEMDPYTRAMYEEAEQVIRDLPLGELPASPVDYWLHELKKAGVKVAEITGRHTMIDYSGDRPRLAKRSGKEVKDRRGVVNGFNNGTIDALIINEAGSTGLSIHASEKFRDNKPRHMIVAQQIKDINVMMQMLGRINRTGQVEYPEYSLLTLAIPAEKRPAARAARKLASLNANTSANDKSDSSFDAPDIFNKYGDQVVNDYMIENPEIARAVNMHPLDQGKGEPDGALRFTGRLAMLTVEAQEQVYADILRLYKEKIEYLDSIGQNDLVAQVLDFDAHIIDSKIVHEGKKPDSVFAGHTTLHKANVKYLGKPPTALEVAKAIDTALEDTTAEAMAEKLIAFKAKDTALMEDLQKQQAKALHELDKFTQELAKVTDEAKAKKVKNAIEATKERIDRLIFRIDGANKAETSTKSLIRTLKIGSRHVLDLGDEKVIGVVTGVSDNHKPGVGLPWAKSKTTITFMVASGSRSVRLPLSYLAQPMTTLEKTLPGSGTKGLEEIFTPELANTDRREVRYIATGNLIAGVAKLEGSKVIMFTDGDGNEHQGLLMPKKYGEKGEYENGNATKTSVVHDPKVLARYLLSGGSYGDVGAFDADRKLSVSTGRDGGLTISVPKANNNKKYQEVKLDRELRDITGDFFGSNQTMVARIPAGKEVAALTRLMDILPLRIPGNYRQHWEEMGGDPAPEALKSFDGKRFIQKAAPEVTEAPVQADLTEEESEGHKQVAKLKPTLTTAKHSTAGHPLYVVNFAGMMGPRYQQIADLAKDSGGRYIRKDDRASYKPVDGSEPDGIPSFVFTKESDREEFMSGLPERLSGDYIVRFDTGTGTGAVSVAAAQAQVAQLERETGVPVKVVKDEDGLPSRIIRQIDRQGMLGRVRGLYDVATGKAYVIADNLKSANEAARVYLHEVVGHMGIRAALGKKLDITLQQIYRDLNPQLKAGLAWKYRRQVEGKPEQDRALILAEEYVALLAESDRQNSALAKVVAIVRRWLRAVGLVKSWQEGDVIELIAQGKKRLRDSRKLGTTGGDARYALQASRDELQFSTLTTRAGHKVWRNDEVTIHADRQITNLEAGLQMGHEAHVPDGVEAWHMTAYSKGLPIAELVVQVEGGDIVGVHNIDSKAPGAGEKVIASLLANSRKGLRVVEAVPSAQGFWSKMGANGFFDQYNNTLISWGDYAHNRQKRAAQAAQQGSSGSVRRDGVLPGAAPKAGLESDQGRAGEQDRGGEGELDAESRAWLENFELRFSLEGETERSIEDSFEALGLGPKKTKLKKLVDAIRTANLRDWWDGLKTRSYEGIFDGLVGIKNAEDAAGVGIIAGDYKNSGYVGARLATGTADLMTAVLQYGAPKWGDGGVIEHKEGTQGLLEIFADLGEDLHDWLGWMGGKRGEELMAQGRENNLKQSDIDNLLALANGRELKFEEAQQKYAAINKAMLDLAEGAGLIDPDSRRQWESEWYIPFYRQDHEQNGLLGPRTKRGLSHQSSGIKMLRGGETATNDLMENILANWLKLADASVKNMALLKTVDNLKDTDYLTNESLRFRPALVTKREMIQRVKDNYEFAEEMRALLRAYNGDVEEALLAQGEEDYTPPRDPMMVAAVIEELESMDQGGIEQLWALTAPAEPDIVRVKRGGKSEYYRVNDPALLRGLVHLNSEGNNGLLMRYGRKFKSLLTTGVTAAPDFMLRNFIRDAVHAWAINKDGFRFGIDSLKSLKRAFQEDEDYRELMFAMASFQGGYVHGTDPEAGAEIIRRNLVRRGMTPAQINQHMDSVVGYGIGQGFDKVAQAWQKYRTFGDRLENTNRLATFKAAKKAGKSLAQAVYESKDLMDYSLRGNWAAMNVLTDLVPFMNARLQGLSKLARAAEFRGELFDPRTWRMDKEMAKAMGAIASVSVLLAILPYLTGDDDRYAEIPDWEKDAYWHIFLGDQHFRIPKPFEIGIVAGTIPERVVHAWVMQSQPSDKVLWSIQHGIMETLNFNPTPQAILPILEIYANRSMYFDSPIESVTDQRKLPRDRYNGFTSEIAKGLGQLTGYSPKKIEHLWNGYTGTLGAYTLAGTDMLIRWFTDAPNRGLIEARDIPAVKSFVRGSGPARSTQFTTDLYDRLEEAIQLTGSFKNLDDPKARKEFMAEYGERIRFRRSLEGASATLNKLRKQQQRILEAEMPRGEKQLKLDAIQRKINAVARRAAEQTEEAFN